jgi:1,4-dihydroxy-2-naphthoate octaprenyltransferase
MIASILKASRPVSWINTAFPFAAGYFMATREVDAVLIVGTLFFLVPYNLLMYGVNDVFDYESDLRNPRKGGIEGDVIRDRSRAKQVHRGILIASAVTQQARRSSWSSSASSHTRHPGCDSRNGRSSTR